MWKRRFLNVEKSVKECIWILISKLQRRTYVATQSSTFQDFEEINKIGFFLKGKRFLCTFASRGFSRSKKKLIFLLLIFFVTLFRWKSVRNITRTLCSRNFQNVKLRIDFVDIWSFTATPILHEIKFLGIQTVQKC